MATKAIIPKKHVSTEMELAEKHFEYVEALKKSLIVSQLGFLKAGEMLYKIKEEKTYEAEDSAHKWTWEDFLSRADLPIPGSTLQSAKRIADTLIRVYSLFVLKLKCKEDELSGIGWTKLNMIAGPIEKLDKNEQEAGFSNWFEKAKSLSRGDLYAEIKTGNAPIGSGLQCDHESEELRWFCPHCRIWSPSNKPLNKKDNPVN